jgi:hypothetical protein
MAQNPLLFNSEPLRNKLPEVVSALEKDLGEFQVFALSAKSPQEPQWNLLVAAGWIDVADKVIGSKIGGAVLDGLTTEEARLIGTITFSDCSDPWVGEMSSHFASKIKDFPHYEYFKDVNGKINGAYLFFRCRPRLPSSRP